jgi:Crp-like helix-turn-helix domain
MRSYASSALHKVSLRYVQVFLRQTTNTALANGRGKIEERLARWLLMAHDRIDSDELKLTQEFLAVMLGVRQSNITTVLQELERNKGLVAHRRAFVTILDRQGLEEGSKGDYSLRHTGTAISYTFKTVRTFSKILGVRIWTIWRRQNARLLHPRVS